jgi:hypothetical protein
MSRAKHRIYEGNYATYDDAGPNEPLRTFGGNRGSRTKLVDKSLACSPPEKPIYRYTAQRNDQAWPCCRSAKTEEDHEYDNAAGDIETRQPGITPATVGTRRTWAGPAEPEHSGDGENVKN